MREIVLLGDVHQHFNVPFVATQAPCVRGLVGNEILEALVRKQGFSLIEKLGVHERILLR
jgi:hypothetical protein